MTQALARSGPASLPLWAPAHLQDFRCVGEACEAHCCGGWSVPVDRAHFVALKRVMDGSRAERERFRALVTRNDAPHDHRHHAFVAQGPGGDCAFLDERRLCSIQARHGEALLPDICSLYPRRVTRLADRLELELLVSCPEAARLVLLDEAPPRLAAAAAELLPRSGHEQASDPRADEYSRYHDDLRGFALEILSIERFPIETRLFLLTFLGQRTRPFLHAGVLGDVSGPLTTELAQLGRPEVQDELARSYAELTIPGPLAELVTLSLLGARLVDVAAPFRELAAASLRSFVPPGSEGEGATSGAELMARYRAARAELPALMAERLDKLLTRFAEHHWLTRPYAATPDLLVYAHDLALRVALLRLLVVGHPRTRAAAQAFDDSDPAVRLRAIDEAAVETVFRFTRAIDHSPAFLRAIGQRLEGAGMVDFPWAVALTRF